MCNAKRVDNSKDEKITRMDLYNLLSKNDIHFSTKWSTGAIIAKLRKSNLLPVRESFTLEEYTKKDLAYGISEVCTTTKDKEIDEICFANRALISLSLCLKDITDPFEIYRVNFNYGKPINNERDFTASAMVLIKNCKITTHRFYGRISVTEEEDDFRDVTAVYDYKESEWSLTSIG